MKHSLTVLFLLGFGWLAVAEPVAAHHAFFGTLDLTTPTRFEGVVTRVEWINPHVVFNIDVKDQTGKLTQWRFEGGSPGALRMRGWATTDLKAGDKVTVEGYRAKNGTPVAGAAAVTLPDGRTLSTSSDGVPPPALRP